VLDLYRAARAIDPANPAAMDALKAVGRRAKNWRAGAALLPEPGERDLAWPERSRRLLARGTAARATDPVGARMWLERAIATDPDNHEAWSALAELAHLVHDADEELAATRSALFAFMRAHGADGDRQAEHARLVLAYAAARRSRGDGTMAARLAWRAYEIRPALPAAALQVASELLGQGRSKDAYTIYDRLLASGGALQPKERLEAMFRRGALRAALGDHVAAIADFRDGLRIEELYPPLLAELAQVLAATGRVANAALHHVQALLLASERPRRAALYARLGRLFETSLGDADEAGVCFDRAMGFGCADSQIMLRALGHYRRKGEVDRALAVIEHLLPQTTKPEDLAALWAERGKLLTERDGDKAVEAFDMALSYDPSCTAAVQGLAAVLEGRGDWKQLLELLEVRAEQGAPKERAVALRGLSRIAAGHLGDAARAEGYLREAIALDAERDDYEQLLKLIGDDAHRRAERRDVIAALIGMGGPLLPRIIEVGRELVAEGKRQWAWSLLSPLMNTTLSEPTLKSLVLELRKEFEKSETVTRLSARTHELVRPTELPPRLLEVLADVDALGPIGPAALDGITLGKLDGRTAVGKTFLALADRLGLDDAALFRAQELQAPFVVLDADTPQVVLRADLVQLMAPGETNYLFTLALEHARAGTRMFAALPQAERALLLPALLQVLGLEPAAPEGAAPLVARIAAVIPEDRRGELASRLAALDRGVLTSPGYGARVAEALIDTARRVALVAAADMRFPAKVLTRLDESLPKLPSAGKIDDLEEFLAGASPVRALVSFAASSQFARALDS
jgi:tetratricopeptide (TPR) repeat protein